MMRTPSSYHMKEPRLNANIDILIVEKSADDAHHLMALMHSGSPGQFHFTHVELLADAINVLNGNTIQLVLLNLTLHDSCGLDTLRRLLKAVPLMPVVVLFDSEDKATCIEATTQGNVHEFLVKDSITFDLLSRVIRYAIDCSHYQESLRATELQVLQNTIDALTIKTVIMDRSGDILAINGAWRTFTLTNEKRAKKVVAHPDYLKLCDQIFDKDAREAADFVAGIRSVLGGDIEIFEMEYSCPRPELTYWYYCRVTAVPGVDQKVMVTHEDITDRKLAEKSLKINEERLHALIDTSPNCVFVTDRQGRYVLVNQAIINLYGISQSEIIGKQNSELSCNYLTKIDTPVAPCGNEHGENGKRDLPIKIDASFVFPDGNVRWFSTIQREIVFPGASDCIVNIAMDVTEQCKAQDELHNSELRMRTILDAQMSKVVLLDPQRRILWLNNKACTDAGLSRQDTIGRDCVNIWKNQSTPCNVCVVNHALQTGEPFSKKKTTPDGKTCRVHGFPVRDDMGRIVSAVEVVEDITERITLEGQLRQAQKMESLGTLAGGIAHDFNNILSGILGYTELALEKSKKLPELTDNLNEVYRAGLRAADLTRQILTFSRRTDTELSPLKIEHIVREASKLLRSSLPTCIEFEVHIDRKLAMVLADPTQIHQVIMNLCTNASHAMEPYGGTLGIHLTQIEVEAGIDSISDTIAPGQYLKLSVSDTGSGMSPEIVALIFDPYFTTKDLGEGTGLGLSVIHGIVNEYGGAISVDSTPGQGSTFNLFFPTVQATSADNEQRNVESLPRGSEKILVIDDEATILKLFSRILERQGYPVTTENDSVRALERFKKDPEAFDLVLSDVTMPKLTGDQLAKEIKAIRPDIPVILCTGYRRMVSEESIKALGVDALLTKPVVKTLLVGEIRRILDQGKGPRRRKTDIQASQIDKKKTIYPTLSRSIAGLEEKS